MCIIIISTTYKTQIVNLMIMHGHNIYTSYTQQPQQKGGKEVIRYSSNKIFLTFLTCFICDINLLYLCHQSRFCCEFLERVGSDNKISACALKDS